MLAELNELGAALGDVTVAAEQAEKCGILGTHVRVSIADVEEGEEAHDHGHHQEHDHEHHHDHGHHHHHNDMHGIGHLVEDHMHLSEKVQRDVMNVYGLIAEAESHAHGVPVTQIHFHEVGEKDAVMDVTAVCLLMEKLGADRVVASPVHVGAGHVHCAHGILPVPAPATAYILKDVPMYGGAVQGELCTPTGAALIKYFADEFGPMPVMRTSAIGYGMGKKDFPQANCVRAMLGETGGGTDEILELSCNLDDMTGEELGFAMDRLLEAGARDVFLSPIQMKKNRPGIMLHVLCLPEERETMVKAIFRHTTTLGVREARLSRCVMDREIAVRETAAGPVRIKTGSGYGTARSKAEFDDLARIALEKGISLREARALIEE